MRSTISVPVIDKGGKTGGWPTTTAGQWPRKRTFHSGRHCTCMSKVSQVALSATSALRNRSASVEVDSFDSKSTESIGTWLNHPVNERKCEEMNPDSLSCKRTKIPLKISLIGENSCNMTSNYNCQYSKRHYMSPKLVENHDFVSGEHNKGTSDRGRSEPRHTRHPAEQVAPGRLSVSVAHYLAVYLRLWDSLGCRIHRRRGQLQAVSLCNDTTGTHLPGIPPADACLSISLLINSSCGRPVANLRGVRGKMKVTGFFGQKEQHRGIVSHTVDVGHVLDRMLLPQCRFHRFQACKFTMPIVGTRDAVRRVAGCASVNNL
ncbi:hypothetical protein WN48_00021 [Eufriesea mexicana]|uniref:Uncharacterized protein n=1 Tax=Eufriesea mexicana TaxID=516756 RepID=A0A310SH13_9HYME|nr:hypothetical protein WN48_00021 [Eufriesea mexicana]